MMNELQIIKEMSNEEIIASYTQYTMMGAMNMKLRNEVKLTESDILRKNRLSDALNERSCTHTYSGIVYRKVSMYDQDWLKYFMDWHEVGRIIKYDEFISSSMSKSFASDFDVSPSQHSTHDFDVMIKIKSKYGVDISEIAELAGHDEGEVLFNCGSKFRVLKSENQYIELEEI